MAQLLKSTFNPTSNAENFEAIYQEFLHRIYNFFLYRFGNHAIAEDLTSATFEKAWKNRHSFRRELAGLSTWLFTIARNTAVDYYRKNRCQEVDLETAGLLDTETPAVVVEKRYDLRVLNTLLCNLPARERELVALKYGANLTNRAIAQLTGLSESNVGVILHRTVQALKNEWESYHE
jgi:RNA polymerase sigma-70 factor, ECF subfamily